MKKSIENQTINALKSEETKLITGGVPTVTLESVAITANGGDGTDENAQGGCGRDTSTTKMVAFDWNDALHVSFAELNPDLFARALNEYGFESKGFSVVQMD